MDTKFVSDKSLTFGCDLDLGRGNLNFVCVTPSQTSQKSVFFFFKYG